MKNHISRRDALKRGGFSTLFGKQVARLFASLGGSAFAWTRYGAAASFTIHVACDDGPSPSLPSAASDIMLHPRDITIRTVREDGSLAALPGANLQIRNSTQTSDGNGIVRGVTASDIELAVASAGDCVSFATPLDQNECIVRSIGAGGNARFLVSLHYDGVIYAPPESVYVRYAPEIWSDTRARETAERIEKMVRELARYAHRPLDFVIGSESRSADLVIPVRVNPNRHGGWTESSVRNNIVTQAWVEIGKPTYARSFSFMFHEVVGHGQLALGHPEGSGIMDPETMYQRDDVDPITFAALVASLSRLPGTVFFESAETDPRVRSAVASTNYRLSVGTRRGHLVCTPPSDRDIV